LAFTKLSYINNFVWNEAKEGLLWELVRGYLGNSWNDCDNYLYFILATVCRKKKIELELAS